jgi:microcystin-dependent protein
MDGFIGEIRAFSFNYVPQGWLVCDGSRVPVAQYQALFSLLWNRYGDTDGKTYFTLPNLVGKTPICTGATNGSPAAPATLQPGNALGAATATLSVGQIANHTHQVNGATASAASAMAATPAANSLLSRVMSGNTAYYSLQNQDTPNANMSLAMIQSTGSSQAHDNMQPYLPFLFCICADGQYPVPQ